jgi:Immunity protein 52
MDVSRWFCSINLIWPPNRPQSPRECAEIANQCLRDLAAVDSAFENWVLSIGIRGWRPIDTSVDGLEQLFLRGRNWTDDGERVMEDLGSRTIICLKAPKRNQWMSMHTHCGCYAGFGINQCELEIAHANPHAGRLLRPSVLTQIMAAIVRNWRPDWGIVSQNDRSDYRSPRPDYLPGSPTAGWLTYLSAERGPLPPLPGKFRVVPVEPHGNIIVAMDDLFDPENQDHMQAIDELNHLLKEGSLLRPFDY